MLICPRLIIGDIMRDLLHILNESSIISSTDSRGIITHVNDKFCEISQYSREELIGKTHLIVNSGFHPSELFKALWLCISSGHIWRGEIKNKAKDGTFYWVFTTIIPLLDDLENTREYVSIRYDITEKKLHEEEARLVYEENLRSKVNKEASEKFISVLTHDMRTPLTSAKLAAQLIERNILKPDVIQKMVVKVIQNINRADAMITDLLNANRIRAGYRIALELSDCNVEEVGKKTIEEMTALYGPRFNIVQHGKCRGQWSSPGVKRIIENLCTNAVKYGQTDMPITLMLNSCRNHLEISVQNFGEVLSKADSKHLFDYLQRSASAQDGDKKGWGIGLTLVKGMTESHGGAVDVVSTISSGTTFTVTLPNNFDHNYCGVNF
jgi:PAS domain S-box-containing protein